MWFNYLAVQNLLVQMYILHGNCYKVTIRLKLNTHISDHEENKIKFVSIPYKQTIKNVNTDIGHPTAESKITLLKSAMSFR